MKTALLQARYPETMRRVQHDLAEQQVRLHLAGLEAPSPFNPEMLMALMLEQAMQAATELEESARASSLLEFRLTLLDPDAAGGDLLCVGELVHQDPTRSVTEGFLRAADGRILARAMAVYSHKAQAP